MLVILGNEVDVGEGAQAIAQRIEGGAIANAPEQLLADRSEHEHAAVGHQSREACRSDIDDLLAPSRCERPDGRIDNDVHVRSRCRL